MPIGKVSRIEKEVFYVDLADGLEIEQECWIEPLGPYPVDIGDIMTRNLWPLGKSDLHNTTEGYTMRAFVKGHT